MLEFLSSFEGAKATLAVANWVFGISTILAAIAAITGLIAADHISRYTEARISENQAKASIADERSSQAYERAAKLEVEAAQARLETERLKAKLGWREISPEQARILGAGFKGLTDMLHIRTYGTDPEAVEFVHDLSTAITRFGTNVTRHENVSAGGGPQPGITACGPKAALLQMGATLQAAGLEFKLCEQEQIELLVGSKPRPAL